MDVNKFKNLPILGILRGIEKDSVRDLVETVVSSGLKTIEITMNTPSAGSLIKEMVKSSNNRITIGAGTVLNVDDLKLALDSGATFIVSPILVKEVMEYCTKHSIPVFPGAFTPQEIYNAWGMGATMVKVFPIKFFGPSYIKEVKAPLNDIEILACSGVNNSNIKSFFSNGASAVAFGGSVFKKEWILAKEFSKIEKSIKTLIDSFLVKV